MIQNEGVQIGYWLAFYCDSMCVVLEYPRVSVSGWERLLIIINWTTRFQLFTLNFVVWQKPCCHQERRQQWIRNIRDARENHINIDVYIKKKTTQRTYPYRHDWWPYCELHGLRLANSTWGCSFCHLSDQICLCGIVHYHYIYIII